MTYIESPDPPLLPVEVPPPPDSGWTKSLRIAQIGTFLILVVAALYFARDFLLPVSLAFLFALVLSPIVRSLAQRHVPPALSAVLLVVSFVAAIAIGLYALTGPVAQWITDAPSIARQLQEKVEVLRRPIEVLMTASDRMEGLATGEESAAREVVLSEPGLISRAASGAPSIIAEVGLTMILLLFLLASGDMFYEKLVKVLPTLSDKKRGVRIAREVEREVSRYLFTITLINGMLGVAVGAAMWLTGMPNPALWGVLTAILNFVPYLGPLTVIALIGVVGLVSTDSLGGAMAPVGAFALITFLEGHLITPMLVGRRLELNAVAVFIAIAFWGWLWGIVGAVLAVPFLVIIKVFSMHAEGLSGLGEFLSARHIANTGEKE